MLKDLGLTQSKYDPCVFFKEGMRIVLYVDDLYITYENDCDIKMIHDYFVNRFGGEIKYPVENTLVFLGMKI